MPEQCGLLLLQDSTSYAQMYGKTVEGREKSWENCLLCRITRLIKPSSNFQESDSTLSRISPNFTSQHSFTSPFPLLIRTNIFKNIFFAFSFFKLFLFKNKLLTVMKFSAFSFSILGASYSLF